MSIVGVILLALAVILLAAAEWPRIGQRAGLAKRGRRRRKPHLRVVEPERDDEDFARSVERDLAALPTIDDRDRDR